MESMEFVPFQQKRKVTIDGKLIRIAKSLPMADAVINATIDELKSTNVQRIGRIAVALELLSYIRKNYPLFWGTLDTTQFSDDFKNVILAADVNAITSELFNIDKAKQTIYTGQIDPSRHTRTKVLFTSLLVISNLTSPIVSKALLDQKELPLYIIDTPLLALITLQQFIGTEFTGKKRLSLLPPYYKKFMTRIYTSEVTKEGLSAFLKSNKRAKKYLRILHKRLGIYSKKKPPFKALPKQAK